MKAPFSWPKSSDFGEGFRQRGGVDGDERPDRAAGCPRGCARATSSLPVPLSPEDQDGRVAGGDLLDLLGRAGASARSDRRAGRRPRAPRPPARSSRFSTSRRRRSSARSRITRSSAGSTASGRSRTPRARSPRARARARPLPTSSRPSPRDRGAARGAAGRAPPRTWFGRRQPQVEEVEVGLRTRRAPGPASRRGADVTANRPLSAQVSCSSRNGSSSTMTIRPSGPVAPARSRSRSAAIAGKGERARASRRPAARGRGSCPRWNRTIWLAVARPSPTPSGFVVSKGWKSRSRRNSGVIPAPLSMISTTRARPRAVPPRVAAHEHLALGPGRLEGVLEEARERVAEVERVAPDPAARSPSASESRAAPPPASGPPRRAGRPPTSRSEAVDVERDLDEHGVLVRRRSGRRCPPAARPSTASSSADRLAELGVLPVLVEVGEQQPEAERHVLDVVDEDAVERRPQLRRGARARVRPWPAATRVSGRRLAGSGP